MPARDVAKAHLFQCIYEYYKKLSNFSCLPFSRVIFQTLLRLHVSISTTLQTTQGCAQAAVPEIQHLTSLESKIKVDKIQERNRKRQNWKR